MVSAMMASYMRGPLDAVSPQLCRLSLRPRRVPPCWLRSDATGGLGRVTRPVGDCDHDLHRRRRQVREEDALPPLRGARAPPPPRVAGGGGEMLGGPPPAV